MYRWIIFSVVLGLAVTSMAHAEQGLDVSQCFPYLLKQQRSFESLTTLELSALAKITDDQWAASQRAGQAVIFGIGGASAQEFSESRRQHFEEHRLDLSYYQHLTTSSVTLDQAAYDVMQTCLKTLATGAAHTGLTYVAVADAKDDVSVWLRLYWNPTNPPYELKASGKIDDGYNPANSPTSEDLFETHWYSFGKTGVIVRDSPPLLLRRRSANSTLRITLDTDPSPVGHEPIQIDPVVHAPVYRQIWVRRTIPHSEDPEKFKYGEENYNSQYEWSEKEPGPLISVACGFNAAYYHMLVCGPKAQEPNTVYCHGEKERSSNRARWAISIGYLQPTQRCFEHCGANPSPLPDEDAPTNYSFDTAQKIQNNNTDCVWAADKVH